MFLLTNKKFMGISEVKKSLRNSYIILSVCAVYTIAVIVACMYVPKASSYAYALYDKKGILIGAQVAADGQWRFEPSTVPAKFEQCIIQFEDSRFYYHRGIDVLSLARAFRDNSSSNRIVSGGSTITMQTARLLMGNKKRTYSQKIKEALFAEFLEWRFSKKQILSIYSSNAPFGGNIIGLEAASWRYFNRAPHDLTWAESATLAVLPNQPSLVKPGYNADILLKKRNFLLQKLHSKGIIDSKTLELSLQESLPGKPYNLPMIAPHFLFYEKAHAAKGQTKFYSTLDSSLQTKVTRLTENWSKKFSALGIENAAAFVIDTKTKNILAYVGNTYSGRRNLKTKDVDMVQAHRSSGSLLKPFLYAAMIDSGKMLPEQLVIDIPTRMGSYVPENNIKQYSGVVPASTALTQSLNIPAARELRVYGVTPFLDYLKRCGFTTFNKTGAYYGIPLILGGGETTLYEITNVYASFMNRALDEESATSFPASVGVSYITLKTLSEGNRPLDEAQWQRYANSKRIAWKTGTSSGNRDAWCIGTTPEYTVGVWVGNAEGNGTINLTSATTAAPVLFDIFSILPSTSFPQEPVMNLKHVKICAKSGYLAGPDCTSIKMIQKPEGAPMSAACPYCRTVTLTHDKKFQATQEDLINEYKNTELIKEKYFVLPTWLERWYVKQDVSYLKLPSFVPWHKGTDTKSFEIVFPEENAIIIIPIEITGKQGAVVFEAAAKKSNSILYWDIDGEFIGQTQYIHSKEVSPPSGKHTLTITDNTGTIQRRNFFVK